MSATGRRESEHHLETPDADTGPPGLWRFGEVRFDERQWLLTVRGEPAEPGQKALRVLAELLRHAGEVVTRDELAESGWPRRIVSEAALLTTISRLRSSLGPDGAAVQTVKGYGYRLVGPVSFEGAAPATRSRVNLCAGDHPPERPDWRLVEPLGAGGQADVWLAKDSAGALRVFKFAADLRAVTALKREVAIFRLLQDVCGDATGGGFVPILDHQFSALPAFIASPRIDGGSLPDWADRQGGLDAVPLALRLELVAQCAEALAIAHGAGVLHKDLKPANVLIDTTAPGGTRVRLADFGSATVVNQEQLRRYALTLASAHAATMTRSLADSTSGTPLYMAPEVLAGQPATERTDLYALGILLYQCAIGDFRRPLSAGWEQTIDDELLREDIALCAAGDPQRRLGDAVELATRLRTLDRRRQQRRAEQAEARRTADLQHELERHRLRRPLLLGIGALLVAGVVGLGLLGWRLNTALAEARRHQALSAAVNEFLQRDILAAAAPQVAGTPAPTMLDVLKNAQGRVPDRFADQPLQEGAVRTALGTAWHLIGNDVDAEDQLRRAIALLEAQGDAALLEAALAHVMLGKNLSIRGIAEYSAHFDRAEALAARSTDPERWKVLARARLARARVHGFSSRARQALAILDPLNAELSARLPGDDPLLLDVKAEYLTQLANVGRHADALAIAEAVLPNLDHGRGRNPDAAADLRKTMAFLLRKLGKIEASRAAYADALARSVRVLGADAAETLATRREIAEFRAEDAERAGDRREADAALAELRGLLGPTRKAQGELAYSCAVANAIVETMIRARRWEEAEADARAAIVEQQTYNAESDGELALAKSRLAHVLAMRDRRDEAATLFAEAMPVIRREMEHDHPVYRLAEQRYAAFQAAAI
ncbi:MAG: winged helix-turn-helix domain-containing protein [Nevskia sp.]|nr:winged helix-turn-helix domain-containing protein [Nevskia sp.]